MIRPSSSLFKACNELAACETGVTEASKASTSVKYASVEGAAVALILLLAGYLRLANVASNPGWYSDEGTLVNIASNVMRGRVQDFALTGSTLLAARLPLFPLLASLWFRIAEPGIPALRVISGSLGVITCGLLYLVIRSSLGREGAVLGVTAAFILAIYPSAVVYSRMGFSYNLVAPLVLVELWGAWRYLTQGDRKALALAAVAVGLGCVTDIMMLVFLVLLGLVVSLRQVRDLPWSIGLAAVPPGIYAIAMLTSDASAFLFDLRYAAGRFGAVPLWAQAGVLSLNMASLLRNDAWMALAFVGVFMLRPPRWRWLVLLALFFPIVAVGRSTGLTGLRTYYVIPLFPLAAIGGAGLLVYGIPVVRNTLDEGFERAFTRWGWRGTSHRSAWVRRRSIVLGTTLGIFLIALAPLLVQLVQSASDTRSGFHSASDALTIGPGEARAVAAFVNQRVQPGELVVASPALGWLLDANVAELEQMVAASGGQTVDFPDDVPADRFAYDMRLQAARFVVVDAVWDNWAAVYMPDVRAMQDEVETWPLALSRGEFRVYENPFH
jgi:4-amino-4-deoxy-L-arabinose transferase-like glycosyltransferase